MKGVGLSVSPCNKPVVISNYSVSPSGDLTIDLVSI